jgi:hypothetical protein
MRTRILRFPDESLGDLLDGRFPKWPKVAEAQGEVVVSGRPKLVLRLVDLPDRQRRLLACVPPDLLYGLCFSSGANVEAALSSCSVSNRLRLVDLLGTCVNDDPFLRLVSNLPALRSIYLGDTKISDFAFRDMPRLLSVRAVRSSGRTVAFGDKGLIGIGVKMPRLLELDISNADTICDEGVRGISHLPLRVLNLSGSRITNSSLASVMGMGSLRKIGLSHTGISDDGLYFLKSLPRLRLLMLNGTLVTDEGLPELQAISGLRVLYLNSTLITDKAARWLANMSNLRVLSVGHQLTSDCVQSLRRALPKCKVSTAS